MEQENLKVLQTMLWGKILSKLCSLYVFSGGDTRTGQTGQTVEGRIANEQPTIIAPAMESSTGFGDISSI